MISMVLHSVLHGWQILICGFETQANIEDLRFAAPKNSPCNGQKQASAPMARVACRRRTCTAEPQGCKSELVAGRRERHYYELKSKIRKCHSSKAPWAVAVRVSMAGLQTSGLAHAEEFLAEIFASERRPQPRELGVDLAGKIKNLQRGAAAKSSKNHSSSVDRTGFWYKPAESCRAQASWQCPQGVQVPLIAQRSRL